MDKKKTGYVIPHTHWDREWRYPLWENRMYLRDLMEELMDTLEKNEDYKSFLLDGQVVAALDYLEVCPESRERLEKLIKDGRIQIGPWYTLPDLYPISGESMIRNLLKGKKEAGKLGGYLKIGYESFGWGQPSQLPQIYSGFDIDTVIISKNVDKTRAPKSEFKWIGADGTHVKHVSGEADETSFISILVLEGEGTIRCGSETLDYRKGDSLFMGAGSGDYEISGACEALITTVRKKDNEAKAVS